MALHEDASAESGSENSENEDEVVYVSSTAPAQLQAPRPSAAPRVSGSYRAIGKKPAYVCPNLHTVAHAAAALPLLRELRAVLGRVAAADAALGAALAIPRRVLHEATDAVDAAVDRNMRVVGAFAADAADACVCANCWPSYALP